MENIVTPPPHRSLLYRNANMSENNISYDIYLIITMLGVNSLFFHEVMLTSSHEGHWVDIFRPCIYGSSYQHGADSCVGVGCHGCLLVLLYLRAFHGLKSFPLSFADCLRPYSLPVKWQFGFIPLCVDLIFIALCTVKIYCTKPLGRWSAGNTVGVVSSWAVWAASAAASVVLLIYTWVKDIEHGMLLCIWVRKS
jgi:hypothetical protein